jgi:xylulokinase
MVIDLEGRVHTFCSAVPNEWHVMGVTQAAGLSLKWFRDNFCNSEIELSKSLGIDPYEIMMNEAVNVPIGANSLIYLPYLMGERTPHLDENCRGAFIGLSAMHTKKDMIRSILEGVSYSLKDCQGIISKMNINISDMTICGGGANSPLWRQMLADLYGCPVKTNPSNEGPALGVAILAGVGSGVYNSVQEGCESLIKTDSKQDPILENTNRYMEVYKIYKKIYPKLKDTFYDLRSI